MVAMVIADCSFIKYPLGLPALKVIHDDISTVEKSALRLLFLGRKDDTLKNQEIVTHNY